MLWTGRGSARAGLCSGGGGRPKDQAFSRCGTGADGGMSIFIRVRRGIDLTLFDDLLLRGRGRSCPDLSIRRSAGHAEVSASDRHYPWLSASSGTQRARDLLIRRYRAGVQPRSDQFVTSGPFLSVVQTGPEHQRIVHPCGSRRGPQPEPRRRRVWPTDRNVLVPKNLAAPGLLAPYWIGLMVLAAATGESFACPQSPGM